MKLLYLLEDSKENATIVELGDTNQLNALKDKIITLDHRGKVTNQEDSQDNATTAVYLVTKQLIATRKQGIRQMEPNKANNMTMQILLKMMMSVLMVLLYLDMILNFCLMTMPQATQMT